jgi:molybdate transport system permease protein
MDPLQASSAVAETTANGRAITVRPRRPAARSWLGTAGIAVTLSLTAFLILPLVALYFQAPLRMLKSAECCWLVQQALLLSLWTSLATTVLTFVVGTPTAFTLARVPFRGRRLVEALLELPLTLPPVVAGVALLLVFGRRGYLGQHLEVLGIQLSFTQAAVVMAQFVVASPYYIKAATGAFSMVPENLLRASCTLGAGPLRRLCTVLLPLCRRGLLAGLAMTWARAMGEFGATLMFAGSFPGRTQTMPLAILATMNENLHAGIVLAVVMLTVCLLVFVVARRLLQPALDAAAGQRDGPRRSAQLNGEEAEHEA